jgi:hypothetical protein
MAGSSSSKATDSEVIDPDMDEPMIDTSAIAQNIQLASLLPKDRVILQSASEAASVAAWTREEEEWARYKTARTGKAKAEAKGTGKGRPSSEPDSAAKGDEKGRPYSEPDSDPAAAPSAEAAVAAKFVCDDCHEPVEKMVEFKVKTWDGTYLDSKFGGILRGTCHACSGIEDAAEFKKAAKASHLALKEAMGNRNARVRNAVYKESIGKVRLEFPHLNHTRQRALAVKRIEAMVLVIGAAMSKAPPEVKKAYVASTAQYLNDIEASSKDPTYVPPVGLVSLTYTETTWLTQVAEGFWISWVCRRKKCRWLGRNDMWIKHFMKERYRCPHCGYQYHPFVDDDTMLKGQKAVTILNPVTMEVQTFLTVWPTNEEDAWLARAVEIRAKELNRPSDAELGEWLSSTAVSLGDLLRKVAVPYTWKTFEWKQEVEWMLDAKTYPKANWERLQAGYVGDILPLTETSEAPFAEWEQLISLLARSLVDYEVQSAQK